MSDKDIAGLCTMEKDVLLEIKPAALVLGVHPDTLRRWVKRGFLKCRRHPFNNYRFFDINDLKVLINEQVK